MADHAGKDGRMDEQDEVENRIRTKAEKRENKKKTLKRKIRIHRSTKIHIHSPTFKTSRSQIPSTALNEDEVVSKPPTTGRCFDSGPISIVKSKHLPAAARQTTPRTRGAR
ncbi:hypothetical protein QTP88_008103 [Uroleucon formosanum]